MKRVFLSFRAEDRQRVNGVRLLAANPRFDLEFYDESVRTPINSSNATYVRSQIREKINRTSVTLCLLSDMTHTSEWVAWELRESIEKRNTIILMGFPNGPSMIRLPDPVAGTPWYLWDLGTLTRMIEGAP